MKRINVTQGHLPPLEEYKAYLEGIWSRIQLTNQGPLLKELEEKIGDYLGVPYPHFVNNGTMALQLALKALDITKGEVITTPFSYVATTSAILWERCTPVYVDIDPDTLTIDPTKIEAAITKDTKAIIAVHVFGNPCDIDAINTIAQKHNLKVIYDAAQAFGTKYKGASLLDAGDISICSFHVTKVFHTVEGGCLIVKDEAVGDRVELIKRFGHNGDNHLMPGINAKINELQAAMGLANLVYIERALEERAQLSALYDELIDDQIVRPRLLPNTESNHAYYPIIFASEERLLEVMGRLNEKNIFPRRYFYPSLNTLPYLKVKQSCPVSEDIAKRVLCLPLYPGLKEKIVRLIADIVNKEPEIHIA